MKVWHISDTHGLHDGLSIPSDIDLVIHSGDATNSRDTHENSIEMLRFLNWFHSLPIPYKVFVAGNHDVSIERCGYLLQDMKELGITYLKNESVTICGKKLWGSPYTPSYGNGWAWNLSRAKIAMVWAMIPDDTDILITHGPPKGVLDYALDPGDQIVSVGDSSLDNAIKLIKPKYCLFGHIHNVKRIQNSGIFIPPESYPIFSNASVISHRPVVKLISNGNIINIS
jgi:Icc-related predicted phosphoesterase